MKIYGIPLNDGCGSETELHIPVHYIDSLNKCLQLIAGDDEDFVFKISKEMTL